MNALSRSKFAREHTRNGDRELDGGQKKGR